MNTDHVRISRARNATRRAVVVLAVLTVITGTFASHAYKGSAAPVYRWSGVTVSGINDGGQIVGTVTSGSVGQGFVWKMGSLHLLDVVEADAINDQGEVLGTNANLQNVIWQHGKTKRIFGLGFVSALNDRGQVLGGKGPSGGDEGDYRLRRLALWTNGTVRLLPFDSYFGPFAMNNRGQVVGVTGENENDAGEWQGGKLTDLGPGSPVAINDRGEILGSRDGDVVVWRDGIATDIGPGSPVAINERGQVIGWHEITPGIVHAFLWSNGTMTDLGGGRRSIPTAISRSGQVVGYSFDRNGVEHGFVWHDGTMTRLPAPKGQAGRPTRAVAINNHNQIVGDACSSRCVRSGEQRGFAVLWTLHGHRIKTLQIAKGHS